MGGTSWSDSHFQERAAYRAKSGQAVFAHHVAVATGQASGIHASLDPKGVKVRESRDSEAHPLAVPVVTLFDVTGSMGMVPRTVQAKLPRLMSLLVGRGYLEHPAIMSGAIGDAHTDQYPLQVGQFESGIEIENDLTNVILEGGGGGQVRESYELALYFLARKTASDHWEKRGGRGYAFVIGDEQPYEVVRRDQVERHLGDRLESDLVTADIVREVQKRYHLYFVLPKMTSYFDDERVRGIWRSLLGENLILLEDPSGVAECIASQIGLVEGTADASVVEGDMMALGASASLARSVSKALVPAGAAGPVQRVPDSGGPSGLTQF